MNTELFKIIYVLKVTGKPGEVKHEDGEILLHCTKEQVFEPPVAIKISKSQRHLYLMDAEDNPLEIDKNCVQIAVFDGDQASFSIYLDSNLVTKKNVEKQFRNDFKGEKLKRAIDFFIKGSKTDYVIWTDDVGFAVYDGVGQTIYTPKNQTINYNGTKPVFSEMKTVQHSTDKN